MTISTHSLVAKSGAALPHVATRWLNLPAAGTQSALPQNLSSVNVETCSDFVTSRRIAVGAQPFGVMANGLLIDVRKQYVHKTRVNAGGDGASGPHPEREPA